MAPAGFSKRAAADFHLHVAVAFKHRINLTPSVTVLERQEKI